ncbi:MAG: hypothetical protein M0026_09340 [Nocardiopsaceae bacterium]|nr:hypothetical protein [Nocardiopsaceae bacterium]
MLWSRIRAPFVLLLTALTAYPLTAAPATADAESNAARYAERLAEDPVYVSDHMGGGDLAGTHGAIAAAVADLDMPVYVLVVPGYGGSHYTDEPLLSAVHDRVGEDGLYLAVTGGSMLSVSGVGYGVDVPNLDKSVEEAALLDDASPVDLIERTVDNITSGEADERLDRARDELDRELAEYERENLEADTASGDGILADLAGHLNPDLTTGRHNIGFLAGILLGAAITVPSVLSVYRRQRRAEHARNKQGRQDRQPRMGGQRAEKRR